MLCFTISHFMLYNNLLYCIKLHYIYHTFTYVYTVYVCIHYTKNQVLESGSLGAYIHRARNHWES